MYPESTKLILELSFCDECNGVSRDLNCNKFLLKPINVSLFLPFGHQEGLILNKVPE